MRIAVVTGASSGMGREYVFAIDREFDFDEIWVIARRKDRLCELQPQCKTKLRPIAIDLSKQESFDEYKELLESQKPQIGLLINNAGYGLFGACADMDVANQLGIIELNDKALTAVCLISLPYMQSGDSIINMGSNSSWQPVPYLAVYAASKAYVLSFSRALGRELRQKGIHVMCVCPGWIKTDFFDRAVHDDTIKYYDRWYQPQDVVRLALKDLKRKKAVSILGLPVKLQVRLLVKHLPTSFIMNAWCRQQGKK